MNRRLIFCDAWSGEEATGNRGNADLQSFSARERPVMSFRRPASRFAWLAGSFSDTFSIRTRRERSMHSCRPVRGLALFLVFLLFAWGASADSTGYRQSVEKWRHDYEADLTSDSGWLSVSGLFWLHEGENRFGSDPLNDIVLPGSAPAQAGSFDFHAGKTTVHIHPGVTATINGKPVESAELHPDNPQERLVLGDLTLYVHASGDRFALRLKDKHSSLLKSFTGLQWFPIDESYALTARFVPYDSPK